MPSAADEKGVGYVPGGFPTREEAVEERVPAKEPKKPEREASKPKNPPAREEKVLPDMKWDRYNMVMISARIPREIEDKLKEADRQIREKMGVPRYGYNKVIAELVAFGLDEYLKLKLKSI